MRAVLLLAFQTMPASGFDLGAMPPPPAPACGDAAAGEITVCGRRDPDRYRLKPLPGNVAPDRPIRAEMGLAGGTLGIVTEQATVGNQTSNRAMVRFKLKF